MSIPFTKYVNIISGVGGGGAVKTRDLIARLFTANAMVDPNSVLEFTNPDDVGTFFGTNSEEYARAVFYFGYISPAITSARRISYARWAAAAFAPIVFGGTDAKSLATFTAITNGSLTITVNGVVDNVTGINLGTAASFADVATMVQTALNASADLMLKTAVVSYDAVRQSFSITGGVAGTGSMSVGGSTGSGSLAAAMELLPALGAINVGGGDQQNDFSAYVSASANVSDNFGSFCLMGGVFTLTNLLQVAQWNKTQNVKYMFSVLVQPADADDWSAAFLSIGGTTLTLASPNVGEYPEMAPMTIEGATDYTKRAGAPNYMYKQFAGLTPSVLDGTLSDTYDNERINYYGRTQSAGQTIDFYQRGTMCGVSTDPLDQNVYANESWLKSDAGAGFMSLQLSVNQLPATLQGAGSVKAVLQQTVDRALFNGVIAPGKALTVQQQLYIAQQTGDALAWHQVQQIGYWMDVSIQSYVTTDGRTEYKAVYTLIYSKSDSIRKIEGSHVLI